MYERLRMFPWTRPPSVQTRAEHNTPTSLVALGASIFGICMGHQLISLAYGAKTVKMKFGHRGGNHPVKNLATGKIEITSQTSRIPLRVDIKAGLGGVVCITTRP